MPSVRMTTRNGNRLRSRRVTWWTLSRAITSSSVAGVFGVRPRRWCWYEPGRVQCGAGQVGCRIHHREFRFWGVRIVGWPRESSGCRKLAERPGFGQCGVCGGPADHAFTAFLAGLTPSRVLRERETSFSKVERKRKKYLAERPQPKPVGFTGRQLQIAMDVLAGKDRK